MKDENGNEYIELDVKAIYETEAAVRFDDGTRKFWIPMSCMEDWPNVGETGTALVAEWFALDEGLI